MDNIATILEMAESNNRYIRYLENIVAKLAREKVRLQDQLNNVPKKRQYIKSGK